VVGAGTCRWKKEITNTFSLEKTVAIQLVPVEEATLLLRVAAPVEVGSSSPAQWAVEERVTSGEHIASSKHSPDPVSWRGSSWPETSGAAELPWLFLWK